jgi:hypothetical protein
MDRYPNELYHEQDISWEVGLMGVMACQVHFIVLFSIISDQSSWFRNPSGSVLIGGEPDSLPRR